MKTMTYVEARMHRKLLLVYVNLLPQLWTTGRTDKADCSQIGRLNMILHGG